MRRVFLVALVVLIAGALLVAVAAPPTEAQSGAVLTRIRALLVTHNAQFNGNVGVGGDVTIMGSASVGGYYPIGSPTDGNKIEFGATGAFTQTVITPAAISTVTAVGCTVNSPSAAAQICYPVRSGKVITLTIVNSAVTPVPIATPHAAGASFWIGGQ